MGNAPDCPLRSSCPLWGESGPSLHRAISLGSSKPGDGQYQNFSQAAVGQKQTLKAEEINFFLFQCLSAVLHSNPLASSHDFS